MKEVILLLLLTLPNDSQVWVPIANIQVPRFSIISTLELCEAVVEDMVQNMEYDKTTLKCEEYRHG